MDEQRDMVYAILAIQKEQQSTADNNKRECRSPSSQKKSRALPAAGDIKCISPVISEDESIFASISAKSKNPPSAFKASKLMAMPSQDLRVQHGAMSYDGNQSSTHQDEVDYFSRFITKETPSRSLIDESPLTPLSSTTISSIKHDTTRQVLRSIFCLNLPSSTRFSQVLSFVFSFLEG